MAPVDGVLLKGLPPQIRDALYIVGFNMSWTFILGELTENYSMVDKVWSFLPPLYTACFTLYPLLDSAPLELQRQGVQPRAALMLALQLLWSFRLTYQANRRGFFSLKAEDYRWPIWRQFAREKLPFGNLILALFDLLFTSIAQNILLFSLALPAYAPSVNTDKLYIEDFVLAGAIVTVIFLEFTSDNQQWAYQNFKYSNELKTSEQWPGARIEFTQADRERGFVTRGLWAYSRHPNCACEQTIWYLMSLFNVVANPSLVNNFWDVLALLSPPLMLSALFIASTQFTESISGSKYTAYKLYQQRVGMFWPTDTVVKAVWQKVRGRKAYLDQFLFANSAVKLVEEKES